MRMHIIRKGNSSAHRINLSPREYRVGDEVVVLRESEMNELRKEVRKALIEELKENIL